MKLHLSWPVLLAIASAVVASWVVEVDDCDGASVWDAASIAVGGSAVWVEDGGPLSSRDIEGVVRGAISLTPHVSVVGGAAYGVDKSYLRSSAGVRLTATDVNNPDFGVGVGVSRHFESEFGVGMNEMAAEAALGWRPVAGRSLIFTALLAQGIDSGRRLFNVGVVFPIKRASGGAQ